MSWHYPLPFSGSPSYPFSDGGVRTPTSQPSHDSSSQPRHFVGWSAAPYLPSPPRGHVDMDLNQSQLEEVVFDSQPPQPCMRPSYNQDHVQAVRSPDLVSTDSTSVQANQQPSIPRVESAGNKRSRKTSTENGTQGKNAAGGRFHWDPRSTLVLIAVKRAHDEGRFHAGVGGKAKTLEEQWVEIATSMADKGIWVDWRVAYDKWKRLSQIHKEIADWERNIPSGKSSYWKMSPRQRKEEGKFGHLNFERDVFEAMERNFGRDPVVNPPPSVIDTTNTGNPNQPARGATSRMQSPTPTSEVGDEFEHTPENSGVQKKTRKRTHVYDVGLKEATKDIAQALGAAEESRDRRHKELYDLTKESMDCNKEMVRIESKKVEMGFQFAAGIQSLSESLKEVAESLRKQ